MNQNEKKILTAEEMIERKYLLQRLCQNTKWRIRDVMEEYAAQQVQEAKEERDKAVELLSECGLQLQYLDHRHPTGTTPNILSRVETFLNSLKQQP